MTQRIEKIKNALLGISKGEGVLDMLMEVQRTMDEAGVFVYKNWDEGELVNTPKITRYWIETSWMYPFKKMPDPNGGLRLEKIGCKVFFEKDIFKKPIRVLEPNDVQDKMTKKAKIKELPVWVVTIKMPKEFVTNSIENLESEILSTLQQENEEISNSYEDGDEDVTKAE